MRTTTIPAYVYVEYQDDDDILAFFQAFNTLAQVYVDFFNQILLPVFANNPRVVSELLDWVGQGLYGITRPVVPLGAQRVIGPFDTYGFATGPTFAAQKLVGTVPFVVASDDIYKRVLTWHHYRGDGYQFSIPWLKRRVARFLFGANGGDLTPDDLQQVSVQASGGVFSVTITPAGADLYTAQVFKSLVAASLLALPFQYSYTVTV